MGKITTKSKSKSGVTMVETAAMLFFIFMLLGLIITGGQMVSNKSTLNYATQSAIRVASVQPTLTKARQEADKVAKEILSKNGLSTSNTKTVLTAASWARGNNFTLQVDTTYKTLFPLVGMAKAGEGNIYKMSSTVVAMVEAR